MDDILDRPGWEDRKESFYFVYISGQVGMHI